MWPVIGVISIFAFFLLGDAISAWQKVQLARANAVIVRNEEPDVREIN